MKSTNSFAKRCVREFLHTLLQQVAQESSCTFSRLLSCQLKRTMSSQRLWYSLFVGTLSARSFHIVL